MASYYWAIRVYRKKNTTTWRLMFATTIESSLLQLIRSDIRRSQHEMVLWSWADDRFDIICVTPESSHNWVPANESQFAKKKTCPKYLAQIFRVEKNPIFFLNSSFSISIILSRLVTIVAAVTSEFLSLISCSLSKTKKVKEKRKLPAWLDGATTNVTIFRCFALFAAADRTRVFVPCQKAKSFSAIIFVLFYFSFLVVCLNSTLFPLQIERIEVEAGREGGKEKYENYIMQLWIRLRSGCKKEKNCK